MKNKIAIIGAAQTRFGENFDMTYDDMAIEAAFAALDDAGLELKDIDACWLGTFYPAVDGGRGESGATMVDIFGFRDKPTTRVSNYCATGTEAIRNAAFAIIAGECRFALALGVEKMRDVAPRESLVQLAASGGHPLFGKGLTAPGMFALRAARYFQKTGIGRETLAKVAVKNHYHGSMNPKAHFRKKITIEQVLSAPMICWPLGLYDCTPTTDGAAAVVLCPAEEAKSLKDEFVTIKGLGLSVGVGDEVFFDPEESVLNFRATRIAARQAYEQAGIKNPLDEIDLAEVHDCFTITEILNYEDLGFAKEGEGWKLIEEGETYIGGKIPVNPSGGLKSSGHPIGASGVRMIVELYNHLLNRAGERQVQNASLGLAHNLGGPGAVAAVAIVGLP